jgi:hypothetical protein
MATRLHSITSQKTVIFKAEIVTMASYDLFQHKFSRNLRQKNLGKCKKLNSLNDSRKEVSEEGKSRLFTQRIAQYKGWDEYGEFISLAKVQAGRTNMRFLGCLWKVFVRDGVKTKEVRNILGIKNTLVEVEI